MKYELENYENKPNSQTRIGIEPKEIKQILLSLKNNRAVGPNEFSNEMIKYGKEKNSVKQ